MTQLIAFEGLSPFLFGTPTYVHRGVIDRLENPRGTAYKVWRGSFMSSGPSVASLKLKKGDRIIVIAHSMGVASAIAWMNAIKAALKDLGVEIVLFVACDGRPLHRPYIKPDHVKRAVSFNQNSWWMTGYEVKGADNHTVTCGHTQVPFLPEVLRAVQGAL